MLAVHVANDYPVKPRMILMYRFLRWFPGLLIFPVLFSGLVYLIFAFPGTSFQTIAWSYAAFILAAIPCGRFILLYLLPEKELRLELFFLTNALVAVLGIVATVNGKTSAAGVRESIDRRHSHRTGWRNSRTSLVEHPKQKQRKKCETIIE